MKKLLAMLLALCMIMSCMVFVVSAEGEVEHVENSKKFNALEIFEDWLGGQQQGAVNAQVISVGPGEGAVAKVIWQYNIAAPMPGKTVQPFDASASTHLEFKLYMNQPEVLEGIYFDVEIRSWTDANGADREENNANVALSDYTENGTFEKGWNTIRIPLADLTGRAEGECNLSSVKWIRFFNNCTEHGDPVNVPADTMLDLMVKDVVFRTDDAVQVTVPLDAAGNWNWDDGEGSLLFPLPAGTINHQHMLMQTTNGMAAPVDLSGMKYVDIYCKVTNAEELRNVFMEFEIGSAATSDVEELHYQGFFESLQEGWNTIRIPFAFLTSGSADACDLTQVDWVRFFILGGSITKDAAMEISYVKFSDSGNKNSAVYQMPSTVTDGHKTEAQHNTGDVGEGTRGYIERVSSKNTQPVPGFGEQMYGDSYVTYKVALNYIDLTGLYMSLYLGGSDCTVEVATRNEDSAYVPIFNADHPMIQQFTFYHINVLDYVKNFGSTGSNLYIRVKDSNPGSAAGYGTFDGAIVLDGVPMTFFATYADWEVDPDTVVMTPEKIQADLDEMTAPEDGSYRPLFGCNTGRGSGNEIWVVDHKNYQGGSSSLSFTIGEWLEDGKTVSSLQNTQFSFTFGEFVGEDYIDATGYDCLEFDFYISNIEQFNALTWNQNEFELTSSGTCDSEENRWSITDFFTYSEGGEPKQGWNKVRLKINPNGDCNLAECDFIRFYFLAVGNAPIVDTKDQALTINMDNMRFTKYFADQEAAARPVAEALAQKIYDALKDIPAKFNDENADIVAAFEANHETWKALYESLNAEFNALDSIAQGLVSEIEIEGAEDDSAKMLRNLNTQLSKYQKYVEDQAKQPDPDPDPDPNPGDPDPDPNPGDPDPDPNPEDPKNPGDDKPGDDKPANNNTTIIIIVVVAVVVVAAAVVAFIVIKKKKA